MGKNVALLSAVGFIFLFAGITWAQKREDKERIELELTGEQVARFDFEQKGIDGWKTGPARGIYAPRDRLETNGDVHI